VVADARAWPHGCSDHRHASMAAIPAAMAGCRSVRLLRGHLLPIQALPTRSHWRRGIVLPAQCAHDAAKLPLCTSEYGCDASGGQTRFLQDLRQARSPIPTTVASSRTAQHMHGPKAVNGWSSRSAIYSASRQVPWRAKVPHAGSGSKAAITLAKTARS